MQRRWATVYAMFNTLLMAAGFILAFAFAWRAGLADTIACLIGLLLGFLFAPCVHELGHVRMGKAADMQWTYVKCACFRFTKEGKKTRFSFASPFAAEQTQMLPKSGGNMSRRASAYTLGGLLFSGIFLAVILLAALLCTLLWQANFVLWGALPYTAYLFLLNAAPAEYASGKTDTLVYLGIKRGYDEEKCMLAAMEIHGRLFAGEAFGEIDEKYYFDVPRLREDEPLYAVLLDLRYRYYLDKGELDKAADALNRLACSQSYLSAREIESVAAELVYMHALRGDIESAEESGKLCKDFLREDTACAKRILAAYSLAAGKAEAVEPLLIQAQAALEAEQIAGVKKLEEKLLDRMKIGEMGNINAKD